MARSVARYVALAQSIDEVEDSFRRTRPKRRRRGWVLAAGVSALVTIVGGGVLAGQAQWLQATDAAGSRWSPFDSSRDWPLQEAAPDFSPSLAERVFGADDCAVAWVARGELCGGVRAAVQAERREWLDVVWTWVGASERLALWRSAMSGGERPDEMPERRQIGAAPAMAEAYHFREHGELQASMRGAYAFLPPEAVRAFTLVSTDLPTADGLTRSRVGQIPHWLKNVDAISVIHHFSIFKIARSTLASRRAAYADDPEALASAARVWRAAVLPTFDSLAIESQLGHINSTSEVMLCVALVKRADAAATSTTTCS